MNDGDGVEYRQRIFLDGYCIDASVRGGEGEDFWAPFYRGAPLALDIETPTRKRYACNGERTAPKSVVRGLENLVRQRRLPEEVVDVILSGLHGGRYQAA